MPRPYVILSAAISVDGYLDDASSERLLLSNAEDFDRVDALRAECDAILVGAATIRADDPRLLVRSEARRQRRLTLGLPEQPAKVTLTQSGRLDPAARFFQQGDGRKLVYCTPQVAPLLRRQLGELATVIEADDPTLEPDFVLSDLERRGVRRLLIEGGGATNSWFLAADAVDELRLAIAPLFVGQPGAPRFVGDRLFPYRSPRRMRLQSTEQIGDMAVLHYVLEPKA